MNERSMYCSAALIAIAVILACAAPPANACTTFCSRGIFGRNYDWNIGYGAVTVNKRGMSKRSSSEVSPAKWISRYGSVTFNQYGRDNATGGMNEAGLVVEVMWLEDTKYPGVDARLEVGALEWVQYQLDNSSTVAEVLVSTKRVRISERAAPIHFLVADSKGNTASIEFLDGQLVMHRDATVLANDPYTESAAALKAGAKDRFARASKGLAGAGTVDGAFALLANVAQPHTQWSIVYDIPNRRITWKTAANPERRMLTLPALDFGCKTPVRMVDVDAGKGDVASLLGDYTTARNLSLVKKSVRETPFLHDMSEAEIVKAAQWPERSACVISRGN